MNKAALKSCAPQARKPARTLYWRSPSAPTCL